MKIISIHTFLAEGDGEGDMLKNVTPSISIHTFLAEGDMFNGNTACLHHHFNPHLPCGR